MIQNLIFGVYLLISEFLVEKLKVNKNYQKGPLILQHSFPKKPHSVYLPNAIKNILLQPQPKTLLQWRSWVKT